MMPDSVFMAGTRVSLRMMQRSGFMRQLITAMALCLFFMPLAAPGGAAGVPATEGELLEWLEGVWVEDGDKALEQIYTKLREGDLDHGTRRQLDLSARIIEQADIRMHIKGDRTVHLEGNIGVHAIDEVATLEDVVFGDDSIEVEFSGGPGFFDSRVPLVLENDGFYFIVDGIKRHYVRQ